MGTLQEKEKEPSMPLSHAVYLADSSAIAVCMITWLQLRTYHLWRTNKEVGLFSEDHLPQSMTQPVQLLNPNLHRMSLLPKEELSLLQALAQTDGYLRRLGVINEAVDDTAGAAQVRAG